MNATWTDDEIVRMVRLRALEWDAWPAFIAQPMLPVAYVYMGVVPSIVLVLVACTLWTLVKTSWASLSFATTAMFLVRLKWITIPYAAFLFFEGRHWGAVVATVMIPLYAAFLNPWRAPIGKIEALMLAAVSARPETRA